jgi:hypothetical protein
MTINEEQELKYLSVFFHNKIGKFSSMKFPEVIEKGLGNSSDKIIKNFIRDGMIADLENGYYEFGETGKMRFSLLKSKQRNEYLTNIAFWIIFVCTIIAAGDVICNRITKYETKNNLPIQPDTTISPSKRALTQTLPYDTIKAGH